MSAPWLPLPWKAVGINIYASDGSAVARCCNEGAAERIVERANWGSNDTVAAERVCPRLLQEKRALEKQLAELRGTQ